MIRFFIDLMRINFGTQSSVLKFNDNIFHSVYLKIVCYVVASTCRFFPPSLPCSHPYPSMLGASHTFYVPYFALWHGWCFIVGDSHMLWVLLMTLSDCRFVVSLHCRVLWPSANQRNQFIWDTFPFHSEGRV